MLLKQYNHFVRPSTESTNTTNARELLNGDDAKKLYLEEVGDVKTSYSISICNKPKYTNHNSDKNVVRDVSNNNLFLIVQSSDVTKLKHVLNAFPDKINILDDYGWSLLMIACQANSIECVRELLNRGIDTTIQDKAGNSALTLVIRNKNIELIDFLINRKKSEKTSDKVKFKKREQFTCSICNKVFQDKQEHLSSTIHNITAGKSKKSPVNYVIPESNKGYQIMLKGGWNKESGLGLDGSGKKYPIKTLVKNDRKGLGHKLPKAKCVKEQNKFNKKLVSNTYQKNRSIEIDFRRQFY